MGLYGVAGKVVVVTGGSRGIGRALARGFVQAGARTYICARDAQRCDDTARELGEFGDCFSIPADLGSAEGCRDFARELASRESRVDVLVNNAGAIWTQSLSDYSEAGWSKVFDLNVKGTFFLVQSLLDMLKTSAEPYSPARVINIGSVSGFRVPEHETYAYSSSKAAVHQLSRHLAAQLAPSGVTVNVIAPGRYRSEMLERAIELEGEGPLLAPIPLGRFVEDDDLVGAAVFLASRAGAAVTGAVLPVDCGYGTVR